MRVCVNKADGSVLEAQSNDDAPLDALIDNATALNVDLKTVDFMILSPDEVQRRVDSHNKGLLSIPFSVDELLDASAKKGALATKADLVAQRAEGK